MSGDPPRLPPRARWLLPALLLVLVVVSVHRYRVAVETRAIELGGSALGTTWSVKLSGDLDADRQRSLQAALEAVLARVDAQMSTWREDSELARFNASAGDAPFVFAPEAFAVFSIAAEVGARSGGALDITVGPLVEAWASVRSRAGRRLPTIPGSRRFGPMSGRDCSCWTLRLAPYASAEAPSVRISRPWRKARRSICWRAC